MPVSGGLRGRGMETLRTSRIEFAVVNRSTGLSCSDVRRKPCSRRVVEFLSRSWAD